ncbi:hypothetical protein Nepgr_002599 [Nepenthes gracilis]|uniref:Uncharacterized protein n=1 Tax=Nepenthes gracilis TaxID=150966 RepID=A0AAD3P840_NEPGR|nr:hypothetical protein Nepgr_002599 [Nepenthes gracilis]
MASFLSQIFDAANYEVSLLPRSSIWSVAMPSKLAVWRSISYNVLRCVSAFAEICKRDGSLCLPPGFDKKFVPDSSKSAPPAQGTSVQACPPNQLPVDLESYKVNDPLIPSGPPRLPDPINEALSESTLDASNLKEETDCFSSVNESASSLLPPLSSAEVVRMDTNLSDADRYAALGDSPKDLESVCSTNSAQPIPFARPCAADLSGPR